MTPTQIANVIRRNLDALPYEFPTRETFALFDESQQWSVKGAANVALRRLAKEGIVICLGFGKNTLTWRKSGPRPIPEWI